jgi:hypothetical protein
MFDPGLLTRVIGVCRPVRGMDGFCRDWFIIEGDQSPINKIVHDLGRDVHKESGCGSRQLRVTNFEFRMERALQSELRTTLSAGDVS